MASAFLIPPTTVKGNKEVDYNGVTSPQQTTGFRAILLPLSAVI